MIRVLPPFKNPVSECVGDVARAGGRWREFNQIGAVRVVARQEKQAAGEFRRRPLRGFTARIEERKTKAQNDNAAMNRAKHESIIAQDEL